jgi:tetratricopeptide (TPR) repeat protein
VALLFRLAAAALLAISAGAQTGPEALTHLKAGSAHLQRGQAEQAVREFKAAVALEPQSAAAHMLLGQGYLGLRSLSMIAEAKAELQQALDLDPDLIWARFYLARVYMDLGRYDRAEQELETALKQKPGIAHFLALLGEVNRKLGKPEASLEWNRKALAADPEMSPAHYHMGLAYMDLKRDDDAVRALEMAVRSKHVAPDMCLTLGSQYLKKRRFRDAEEVVRRGIALDPSRPEGHLNLAQLFNTTGSYDRALAETRLALPEGKSFPTSPYYQQLHADILFERGRAFQGKRDAARAAEAYRLCLDVDPSRAEARRRLGEVAR